MLELRPTCECCDRVLAPDAPGAFICTMECTFCHACAEGRLGFVCPNCGGELVRRPARPTRLLDRYPPSAPRVHQSPAGCAGHA